MSLTVILPVYNCVGCIGPLIGEIKKVSNPDWQFIFVDDCSTDGSVEELKESLAILGARARAYSTLNNVGSHRAVIAAISEVKTQFLAFMAADGQDDPAQLHDMLLLVQKDGSDTVFTSSVANDTFGQLFHFIMRTLRGWDVRGSLVRWNMALTSKKNLIEASINPHAHLYYALAEMGSIGLLASNKRARLAGRSQWTTGKKFWFSLVWLSASIVPKRWLRASPPRLRPL